MQTGRSWSLRRIVDIRSGEVTPVLAMAALYFFVIGAASLVKPVRQAAFLDAAGANAYPFVLLGTAVVVALLMGGYARLAEQVRVSRLLLGTYVFLALNLVGFWWLFRSPIAQATCVRTPDSACPLLSAPVLISAAFFIWAAIYSVLTVSQFWLLANLGYDARQAKRLFGFIGAGGIVGGIVGSWAASVLAKVPGIGRVNIVLLSAAALLLAAALAAWILARTPAALPAEERKKKGAAVVRAGAAALVRESPHLRAVAAILLVIIVVSAIADQQLNSAVEAYVPQGDARTAFFGQYFAVTNVISLFVQLFVTSFVLRRFGVGVALLLLPIAMLGTSVALLVAPSLLAAAVVRGADQSLRYSLDQSTRELLFLPVPAEIKGRVKPFIDVAVQRSGKGLSAILILVLLTWLKVPFQYLSVAAIFVIGIWLACVWIVKREYVAAIKRMISVRDVQVDELVVRALDADSRRELATAAVSGDPAAKRFALELLRVAGEAPEGETAAKLQYPSIVDVESRAEQVRAEIARGVTPAQAEAYLADPLPRVRAGAVAALSGSSDAGIRALAEDALRRMAEADGPLAATLRREAALVVASLPASDATTDVLRRLLSDDTPAVRKAACVAAGRLGKREFVPRLLAALLEPELRDDARDALHAVGGRAAGSIGDTLRDASEPREIRIQAARVLAGIPGALTAAVLVAALDDADAEIRYHALKSLNRLRRDHPDTVVDAAAAERALERELASLRTVAAAKIDLAPLITGDGPGLLAVAVAERRDDGIERVARALGLVYPLSDMVHAYRAVASGDASARTSGLELLENVLSATHRRVVIPALDVDALASVAREAPPWRADTWLVTCAAHAATRTPHGESAPPIGLPTLEAKMMSILDRAEFLRNVEFLSLVRTEYLAKIAAVMTERAVNAGDEVVAQGATVDQVYLVASGKLVARRDGQVLFMAGRGDAVGALSVLDGKPSPFAAVALEKATVLSVGSEEFSDLMHDNNAIMLGLLRYLAGQVRELSSMARQTGKAATTIS